MPDRLSSFSPPCKNVLPSDFSTNTLAMAVSLSGLKACISNNPFTDLPVAATTQQDVSV